MLASGMDWQPIETAPRNGSKILVAWKGNPRVSVVWWNSPAYPSFTTGAHDTYDIPDQYGSDWFTHWMLLPNPPA